MINPLEFNKNVLWKTTMFFKTKLSEKRTVLFYIFVHFFNVKSLQIFHRRQLDSHFCF